MKGHNHMSRCAGALPDAVGLLCGHRSVHRSRGGPGSFFIRRAEIVLSWGSEYLPRSQPPRSAVPLSWGLRAGKP